VRGKRLYGAIGVLAAAVAICVLVVAETATARTTASCGNVTLNEQAWTGSTANTYIAKYVLEHYLGCSVKVTDIAEIPVYQAMAQGKVDAVLEDWQHVAQYKQYGQKQHSVVVEGSNGLTGHIGWFIPRYLLKQYPEFKTWKGLKGHEKVFASPEAPQGMFLGGDPSYEQKDTQLIQALGLNLKHVTVGAETAEFHNATFDLVEVKLPSRGKNCQDDGTVKAPLKDFRCAYSSYPLEKVFSSKFVKSGSPAVAVLKRFKWPSNSDQNMVSEWIAGQHMDPEKAAEKYVKSHMSVVNKWLGK